MERDKIPPMEELEKVIDSLLNGQEPKSNLDPEIIKAIKSSYEKIKKINPDKDFKKDLLSEIVKKLDKEKQPVFNAFYIKAFSGLFASLVLVVTAYFFLQNMKMPTPLDQLDDDSSLGLSNELVLTDDGKSPVLERFGVTEKDTNAIKDTGEYKERFTDRTDPDNSLEFTRTGGGDDAIDEGESFGATEEVSLDFDAPLLGAGAAEKSIAPPRDRVNINNQEVNDLKGGETDDNENFDDYEDYFKDAEKGSGYDIDISQRFLIEIADDRGKGVLGKEVIIVDDLDNKYELVTDADGKIYFYPSVYTTKTPNEQNGKCFDEPIEKPMPIFEGERCNRDYTGYYYDPEINMCVKASASRCSNPYPFDDKESCEKACLTDEQEQYQEPSKFIVFVDNERYSFTSSQDNWEISLDEKTDNQDDLVLDLAFTLDTTGSMSDQINKLTMTIESISEKVTSMRIEPKIRYGLVVYRDRGDDYITRIYDFTEDLDQFKSILETIEARAGGDYEEDVNSALEDTLEELSWSNGKNTVKIDFLVADAPPHMDYGQKYDYRTAMLRALELGVKIFPIASSGLDNTEGEFMFRQIALITNAKYVFITDARGGTDYHVSEQEYSVNALDQLIVNLIEGELEQIE